MFKGANKGNCQKMTQKHFHRYVDEFAGRLNVQELVSLNQIDSIANKMEGMGLKYIDLAS